MQRVYYPPQPSFATLLLSIIVLLSIGPFTPLWLTEWIIPSTFTLVVIATLFFLSRNVRVMSPGVILAVPSLVFIWVALFFPLFWLKLLSYISLLCLMCYATVVIARSVFLTRRMDATHIFGAVSVYLLLAINWALVFLICEEITPGALQGLWIEEETKTALFDQIVYFSLVTLSTLGYGDFVPMNPQMRILAALEAVSGQFYIATLVAGLVSALSHEKRDAL